MPWILSANNGGFGGNNFSNKPLCKFIESINKFRISSFRQPLYRFFRTHQRALIENKYFQIRICKNSILSSEMYLLCYNEVIIDIKNTRTVLYARMWYGCFVLPRSQYED